MVWNPSFTSLYGLESPTSLLWYRALTSLLAGFATIPRCVPRHQSALLK